ncbi:uncharacterized protein LOC141902278 isoform X1 [Tubulanus polymorphus]|uniref:uncharacterized protein LOC141902278 isoform X1 n=1 Tax=Tubulanus polymorphus TaxID=672921 RepID=UPI003DA220F6
MENSSNPDNEPVVPVAAPSVTESTQQNKPLCLKKERIHDDNLTESFQSEDSTNEDCMESECDSEIDCKLTEKEKYCEDTFKDILFRCYGYSFHGKLDLPQKYSNLETSTESQQFTSFYYETNEEKNSSTQQSTSLKTSTCGVCKKSFANKYKIPIHSCTPVENSYHGDDDELYECDLCDESFTVKNRLIAHYIDHTDKQPSTCDICQKLFSSEENLSIHVKQRHGDTDRPYVCDLCHKTFSEKSYLAKHLKVHSNDRPFKCSICLKAFRRNTHLTRHMKTHSGVKPFSCAVCHKSFTTKYYLEQHTMLHVGEDPLACAVCQIAFDTKTQLIEHMKIHFGEKPFKCDVCLKTFAKKCALTVHRKTHKNGEFSHDFFNHRETSHS